MIAIELLMLTVAVSIAVVMAWKCNRTERALTERIEAMERVLDLANIGFVESTKDKRTTRQPKSKMYFNGRASAFADMLIAIKNYKEEAKDEEA